MTLVTDLATAKTAAQQAVNDANGYVTASVNTPTYWYAIKMLFDATAVLNDINTAIANGAIPPLKIITTALPQATVGTGYSFQMIGTGGSGTPVWSASGLPAGLAISLSGKITGMPSSQGTVNSIVVTLSDSNKDSPAWTTYSMVVIPEVVTPPPPAPTIPPLAIYGNGGTYSNGMRVANELHRPVDGISNYCVGSTWGSIQTSGVQSWANPLPAYTAVNLCPDNGNLDQVAGNLPVFTTVAEGFLHGTIARLGWEPDGNWFTWCYGAGGKRPVTNTLAKYITAFRAATGALRQGCPTIKIDWCTNSGSSTLAQLEAAYPGDDVVDIIGFDHYDAGTIAANLAAVTPAIQMASLHNKELSIGEFGASGTNDSKAFIDFMGMLVNNPTLFSKTYGLPPYRVAYSSLFTDSTNNIENKPGMMAEFPIAFPLQ